VETSELSTTEADAANQVTVGDPVNYTITVTSDGPDTAQSVVMTNTLTEREWTFEVSSGRFLSNFQWCSHNRAAPDSGLIPRSGLLFVFGALVSGLSPVRQRYDFNRDGTIDVIGYLILVDNLGQGSAAKPWRTV
jgi:uncharacterized repeat protein (TIGR01451 family)